MIPIEADSIVRQERIPGAEAVLVYHNKFGLEYKARLDLIQSRRDDVRYNYGSAAKARVVEPQLTNRDVWRLHSQV